MKDYIAWIKYEGDEGNGVSVFRGTLKQCEKKAMEVHNDENWKTWSNGRNSVVKYTRGVRQLFAGSYTLSRS